MLLILFPKLKAVPDNSSMSEPMFSGVDDPVVCLEFGEGIVFMVSNQTYPIYDNQNLWNSNPEFDSGLFSQLSENQLLTEGSTFFPFIFNESGVFVFSLNNSPERRLYVRVVEQTAQCPQTGPFFPLAPSQAVQLGIVLRRDILQQPDWVLLGILLSIAFALMALVVGALVSSYVMVI